MTDNISKLYGALRKYGYSESELGGNEDSFRELLKDEKNRDDLYRYLSDTQKNGFVIGDRSNYDQKIGSAYSAQPQQAVQPQQPVQTQQPIQTQQPAQSTGADANMQKAAEAFAKQYGDSAQGQYLQQKREEEAKLEKAKAEAQTYHDKRVAEIKAQRPAIDKAVAETEEEANNMLDSKFATADKVVDVMAGFCPVAATLWRPLSRTIGSWFSDDIANAKASKDKIQEVKDMLDEAEYADSDFASKQLGGVLRGTWRAASKVNTWDFEVSNMTNALTINQVIDKWENLDSKLEKGETVPEDEKLSATDLSLLKAIAISSIVSEGYGEDIGLGYKIGESLPQSAAFASQMGAFSKITKAGMLGAATTVGKETYGLGKLGEFAVAKYGAEGSKWLNRALRIGGDLSSTVLMTGSAGLPGVVNEYQTNKAGQTRAGIDRDGNVMYFGQDYGEDGKQEGIGAFASAFEQRWLENATEYAGEYMVPLNNKLVSRIAKNMNADNQFSKKLVQWLYATDEREIDDVVRKFLDEKTLTRDKGAVGKFFNEAHISSQFRFEFAEEKLGDLYNAVLHDDNFDLSGLGPEPPKGTPEHDRWEKSFFNWENNLVTFFSTFLMVKTPQYAQRGMTYASEHGLRKAGRALDDVFPQTADASGKLDDTSKYIRDLFDKAEDPKAATAVVRMLINNGFVENSAQYKALIDYAAAKMQDRVMNVREAVGMVGDDEIAQQANAAYSAGRNMTANNAYYAARRTQEAERDLYNLDPNLCDEVNRLAEDPDISNFNKLLQGLDERKKLAAEALYYNRTRLMGYADETQDGIDDENDAFRSVVEKAAIEVVDNADGSTRRVIRPVELENAEGQFFEIGVTGNTSLVMGIDGRKQFVKSDDIVNLGEAEIEDYISTRNERLSQAENDRVNGSLANHPLTQQPIPGLVLHSPQGDFIVQEVEEATGNSFVSPAGYAEGQWVPSSDETLTLTPEQVLGMQNDYYYSAWQHTADGQRNYNTTATRQGYRERGYGLDGQALQSEQVEQPQQPTSEMDDATLNTPEGQQALQQFNFWMQDEDNKDLVPNLIESHYGKGTPIANALMNLYNNGGQQPVTPNGNQGNGNPAPNQSQQPSVMDKVIRDADGDLDVEKMRAGGVTAEEMAEIYANEYTDTALDTAQADLTEATIAWNKEKKPSKKNGSRLKTKNYWEAVVKALTDKANANVQPGGQQPVVGQQPTGGQAPATGGDGNVPDITMDTPAAARARGYVMINGQRLDRQPVAEPLAWGNETTVYFGNGANDAVKARFALVPRGSFVTSHKNGQPVPLHFFMSQGQPKPRTDAASIDSKNQIAANPDTRIINGETAFQGAPVGNTRLESVQGNNRGDAIQSMTGDALQHYHDMIGQSTATTGFTPEQVAQLGDVELVRIIDVSDEEAIRLGNLTSEGMESGGEQALNAANIGQLLLSGGKAQEFITTLLNDPQGGNSVNRLARRNGIEALKIALAANAISQTQYQSAVKDGKLTTNAISGIEEIAAKLFLGDASPVMQQAWENLPEATQRACIFAFAQDVNTKKANQIIDKVRNALNLYGLCVSQIPGFGDVTDVNEAKAKIKAFVSQGANMFDSADYSYTPLARLLAAEMQALNGKELENQFKKYYELVYDDGSQSLGFEGFEGPKTKAEAIEQVWGIKSKPKAPEVDYNKLIDDFENGTIHAWDVIDAAGINREHAERAKEILAEYYDQIGDIGDPDAAKNNLIKKLLDLKEGKPVKTLEEERIERGLVFDKPTTGKEFNKVKENLLAGIEYYAGETDMAFEDIFNKFYPLVVSLTGETTELKAIKTKADNYADKSDYTFAVENLAQELSKAEWKDPKNEEKVVSSPGETYNNTRSGEKARIVSEENGNYTIEFTDRNNNVSREVVSVESFNEDILSGEWVKSTEKNDGPVEPEGNDGEAKPLTRDEIINSGVEQIYIDAALDYLDEEVHDNDLTQAAYQYVEQYVRDRQRAGDSNSPNVGAEDMGGSNSGAAGEAGEQGGTEGQGMAGEGSAEPGQPGGERGDGGETGGDSGAPVSGEGSGSETGNAGTVPDGATTGGTESPRRRRNSGGGHNLRNQQGEGAGSQNAGALEGGNTGAESDLDAELEGLMGELGGILLGKNDNKNILGMAVLPFQPQMARLLKAMPTIAKIGNVLLKKGYYKFDRWQKKMHELLDKKLEEIGLKAEEIAKAIKDCWNTSLTIDGQRKKLSEWAKEEERNQLRKEQDKTLEQRRAEQKEADNVEVKLCDRDNIDATLPFLFPAQRDDVMKAETQFFSDSHNNAEHCYGKGMLFTNGTGTGKTYTGLGIIKRFVQSGKGRVLIIAPSEKKEIDWSTRDAQNMNLTVTPLRDSTKEKDVSATRRKGEGIVVTTFENFRDNIALLEDVFDLIVCDEAHKLLQNKDGKDTDAAKSFYMITNRDDEQAIERLKYIHPLWIEERALSEEKKALDDYLYDESDKNFKAVCKYLYGDTKLPKDKDMSEFKGDFYARRRQVNDRLDQIPQEQAPIIPTFTAPAREAAKKTKVVLLSATPFRSREALRWAAGFIYNIPDGNFDNFLLSTFPEAYVRSSGKAAPKIGNAKLINEQEVAFADHLLGELQTMSGRSIDVPYDYSRDFPIMDMVMAGEFNQAHNDLASGEFRDLYRMGFDNLQDYPKFTVLFETLKAAVVIPRIKEHLAAGRKVAIYHSRRNDSAEDPVAPPFRTGLDKAIQFAQDSKDNDLIAEVNALVRKFEAKYSRLLRWEQTLDYRLPREQLAEAFGEDMVGFFSGAQEDKRKGKAKEQRRFTDVNQFNSDTSGKDILVCQIKSAKEGIDLHDTTGNHQRVLMTLSLPDSSITFIQVEGRIFRIGTKSNAIFEYPLLGLDLELGAFASKINSQAATTENLALGSMARDLRESIAQGILQGRGIVPTAGQGVGGKEFDNPSSKASGIQKAIDDYNSSQKGGDYPTGTPEPLGYMMVQWADMKAGEKALEPGAGKGNVARYFPLDIKALFMETDRSMLPNLMLNTGAVDKDADNAAQFNFNTTGNSFDDLSGANKYDTIVMVPTVKEEEDDMLGGVTSALTHHLNNSGRVVATIPSSMVGTLKDTIGLYANAKIVAEIKLPACTYGDATMKDMTTVIFDKVDRSEIRGQYPAEATKVDLSGCKTREELFEKLDKMPPVQPRILDPMTKRIKRGEALVASLKNNPIIEVTKGKNAHDWTSFNPTTGYFYMTPAWKGAKINIYGALTDRARSTYGYIHSSNKGTLNYDEIEKIGREQNCLAERIYIAASDAIEKFDRNDLTGYRKEVFKETSTIPDDVLMGMYKYQRALCAYIREVCGFTDDQIRRAANGENLHADNRVTEGTVFSTREFRSIFEDTAKSDAEMMQHFDLVFPLIKKQQTGLVANNTRPGSAATYSPRTNTVTLNPKVWNRISREAIDNAVTLLHEMSHMPVAYARTAAEYGYSMPEALSKLCRSLDNLFNGIMNSPDSFRLKGEYGLSNADELISESSDPNVREKMKRVRLWKKESNGIITYKKYGLFDTQEEAAEEGYTLTNAYAEALNLLTGFVNNFDLDLAKKAGQVYEGTGNWGDHLGRADKSNGRFKVNYQGDNLGIHAGDLGKADDTFMYRMGGSRGTGHFGTGTYFVGDKANFHGGYEGRPQHGVYFTSYNLFRPKDREEGFTVHSYLREVNTWFSTNPAELETEQDFNDRKKNVEDALDDVLVPTEEQVNKVLPMVKEFFGNDNYNSDVSYAEGYLKEGNPDAALDRLYRAIDHAEWDGRKDGFDSFRGEQTEKIASILGTTPEAINKALDEIYEETKDLTWEDQRKHDSASTMLMKKLGFEGVDVRGIKGLDNTDYGSVIYDLRPEDVRFRSKQTESNTENTDKEAIRDSVQTLADNLNVPVTIGNTIADFPDAVQKKFQAEKERTRKKYGRSNLTPGLYYNGKVYVLLSDCADVTDGARTILHEIVGHKGLRELFGKEYKDFLLGLHEMMSKADREAIQEKAERNGWDIAKAMDEYLAEQAEEGKNYTLWDRITKFFNDFMRKWFKADIKLNSTDVRYLLWRSRQKLTNDDHFDFAKDSLFRRAIAKANKVNAVNRVKAEVATYASKYNTVPVVVVNDFSGLNKAVLEDLFGQKISNLSYALARIASFLKDNGTIRAIQIESTGKIVIFADRYNESNITEVERALFHENMHAFFRDKFGPVGEEIPFMKDFYSTSTLPTKAWIERRKGAAKLEEYLVTNFTQAMYEGNVADLMTELSGEGKQIITEYLSNTGYDIQSETDSRRNRVGQGMRSNVGLQKSASQDNSEVEDSSFRLREKPEPKKTGIGYKVFVLKNGQLYPPMVANPNGEATPVGKWLDADAAPISGQSKTGRNQVKAGGKGTQGGSGQLSYRPGWHLGTIPYALQFNRKNEATGERELFPNNFVWAEVEYANDVDYQQEAHDSGINANGKYQHSLAGLQRLPEDGSYMYRTNPDPRTDPWIITGAMKVKRILTPSEVDNMVREAGREPQPRQAGAITDEQINELNKELGLDVDDTAFRSVSPSTSAATDPSIQEAYDAEVSKSGLLAKEAWVDMLASVKKMQDIVVEKTKEKLLDTMNVYQRMIAVSSRNQNDMKWYKSFCAEPLFKAIFAIAGDAEFKKNEKARLLDRYCRVKHGIERNRDMAVMEQLEVDVRNAYYTQIADAQSRESDPKIAKDIGLFPEKYGLKAYDTMLHEAQQKWFDEEDKIRNNKGLTWYEQQIRLDDLATNQFRTKLGKEYAGVGATLKELGEKDAYTFVTNYEKSQDKAKLDALWDAIHQASNVALEEQQATGLVSQEYVDFQKRRYQFYVPLRGFAGVTASDKYDYPGENKHEMGNPVKTAKGRESEADNCFSNLLSVGYRSFSSGNHNQALQALWNLARSGKTDGLLVGNRAWEQKEVVGGVETWKVVTPDIPEGASYEEVAQALEDFEKDMQRLRKIGEARQRRKGTPLPPYRTTNVAQKNAHHVHLYIGGELRVVTVVGNPRVAMALNGQLNPDNSDNNLVHGARKVQNFMAGAFTSYNPAFATANLVKDSLHANMRAGIDGGWTYWRKFTAKQMGIGHNWVKMMRLLKWYNSTYQKSDRKSINFAVEAKKFKLSAINATTLKNFVDFMEGGGATGYTWARNDVEALREIEDEIKKLGKRASAKSVMRTVLNTLEFWSESSELVNRFIAFEVAKETGKTNQEAVDDAKNITLNFNRKGAGVKTASAMTLDTKNMSKSKRAGRVAVATLAGLSSYGKGAIVFFNANVQATQQLWEMTKKHPLKMTAGFVGAPMVAAGVVMPILNNLVLPSLYAMLPGGDDGDDDKEYNYYDELPDYIRQRNICIRKPGGGWFFIPLTPELSATWSMGDALGGNYYGRPMHYSEMFLPLVDLLMPVDADWSEGGKYMPVAWAPSAIQPAVHGMLNRDWKGAKIKNENQYNKDLPEFVKTFRGTSPSLMAVSKFNNEFWGGNNLTFEAGSIDINPGTMKELVSGYLGGFGTTLIDAIDVTYGWFNADAAEERKDAKIPLIGRFYLQSTDGQINRQVQALYYDRVLEFDNIMQARERKMRQTIEAQEDKIAEISYAVDPIRYEKEEKILDEMNNAYDEFFDSKEWQLYEDMHDDVNFLASTMRNKRPNEFDEEDVELMKELIDMTKELNESELIKKLKDYFKE